MKLIIGFAVVISAVFGGFVLSHGNLAILFQPLEVLIILGAAFGAMVISTPMKTIREIFSVLAHIASGKHTQKAKATEALLLMFDLFNKGRKEGMIALEREIESPQSGLFAKRPIVFEDKDLTTFITDYIRIMMSGTFTSFEVESLMDMDIDSRQESNMAPADAVATLAEGLPAFGIVAAVLGVVITMSSIGGPLEETGMHVASALVGTMLGILMAYGFVSPIAHAMEKHLQDNENIMNAVKASVLACLNGYAPQLSVEFGRVSLPLELRPEFSELEKLIAKSKGR